tara:strand:+ start:147 stop:785 length:639 start_codon:yes stop_codon:yes gene_type:complete
MKILLVAATPIELESIQRLLEKEQNAHEVTFLVTGVGMIATTFSLTKELASNSYDLAINLGIAGAFDNTISLGEVVEVVQDQFSEELVEDGEELKTYQEIGLRERNEYPFIDGVLNSTFKTTHSTFIKVKGITVNTVHGNERSIKSILKRLNPQIESMEGAAFFYVCNQFKTATVQIRAISNYAEKRNRDAWRIELALNNLAEATKNTLNKL